MKIRIKDIARLAKVSSGTVDRVIHNRGEVSDNTRKRIQEIIDELNYQPDILARTLASKRNYIFTVLIPVSVHESDFWNAPKAGIEKAIQEISPFGVEIREYSFDQFDVRTFLNISQKLIDNKPDAVLFAPVFPKESVKFIETCQENDIPVMLFNSNLEEAEDIMFIGQDALQSGYLAAKLLIYGLKRDGDILIVNIAGRKDNHNHILRRERGFRKYFADNQHIKSNIHIVDCLQFDDKNLKIKLDEAFKKLSIEGIFVTNSRVFQVAEYLDDKLNTDVKLLGYDLLPQNIRELKNGKIDFLISQKPEEQGYKGIMSLFNSIVLKREVKRFQYIPIDIITRENINFYEYK